MTRAELVLYNAAIYTMNPAQPTAEAIGLSRGRIVAIGDSDSVCQAAASPRHTRDLGGRVVIPGLIDAHVHFCEYSLRQEMVDIYQLPSLQETLDRIAAKVEATAAGAWIRGGGWNCNLWQGGSFPSRAHLDRVAPHHPVALSSKDGHSLWVNSRALALAGIDASTNEVEGGAIFRDASGEPTGILQENAMGLVYDIVPRPGPDERRAACRRGMAYANQVGLTGIHDCEGAAALTTFQQLAQEGDLTLRVLAHIPESELDAAIEIGLRDGFGNDWLSLGGIKAFGDGALGSRSAWMLAPYEGDPSNRGIPTTTPEALEKLVRKANDAGLSVAVHAIGDAANRAVLDAVEAAADSWQVGLRNQIEHVQLLHPDDIPRFSALGVVASMQPIHATSDIDIAERHWGERAATSYAWRSLLDAGAVLAFGSDAPVEDISPLIGIHAAVTRQRADGYPGLEGWYPEQRLSVGEAVHAYTVGAAYAGGQELSKGSLTPGRLADLVILDRDIFRIAPDEILDTKVCATVVGGQFAYESDL
jgi:predicted amidohydrolase YtcJ